MSKLTKKQEEELRLIVKMALFKNKIRQNALAKLTGYSRPYISKILSGSLTFTLDFVNAVNIFACEIKLPTEVKNMIEENKFKFKYK